MKQAEEVIMAKVVDKSISRFTVEHMKATLGEIQAVHDDALGMVGKVDVLKDNIESKEIYDMIHCMDSIPKKYVRLVQRGDALSPSMVTKLAAAAEKPEATVQQVMGQVRVMDIVWMFSVYIMTQPIYIHYETTHTSYSIIYFYTTTLF